MRGAFNLDVIKTDSIIVEETISINTEDDKKEKRYTV